MLLKHNEKEAGQLYMNIQLDKSVLGGMLAEIIKGREVALVLDSKNFIIKSYRKMYSDTEKVYFEGAEIKFI